MCMFYKISWNNVHIASSGTDGEKITMNSLYKEETFKLEGGKTDTKKLQKIEAGRKNQRNSQNT